MIPICIVTRNRHTVLDITLRSLSASDLPDDQVLVIFDDASDNTMTQRYLYTKEQVPLLTTWPNNKHWREAGLGTISSRKHGLGIDEKIMVVRFGTRPTGVVNASCRAFREMIERHGTERGIIIVQDDVVFCRDWLSAMRDAEKHPENTQRPVGLIAGCWLNKRNPTKRTPMTRVVHGGPTAQCLYVTEAGIRAVLPWASQVHTITQGFDNKFCAHVRGQADIYRMHPAVCQHIGVRSLVRPWWKWSRWHAKGRIDFSACGPFQLADDVRAFAWKI